MARRHPRTEPPWMMKAEQLARQGRTRPVNARGERVFPVELPKQRRDEIVLEEEIRRKMLLELGGDPGFGIVPRVAKLARLCSLDLGRDVTEKMIRDYLGNGDFDCLRPVWVGYTDDEVREIKATLRKEILGP